MKTLLVAAALAAFTAPALAGILPIKGAYCGSGDNYDAILDTNGVRGEQDGCSFKAVISSGPRWWIVSQVCSNTADEPMARVEIKGENALVSDYWKPDAAYQKPYTLHRCR